MLDQLIGALQKPETFLTILGTIFTLCVSPFIYNSITRSIRKSNRKSDVKILYEQIDIDDDHEYEISFSIINNSDQSININGFDLIVENYKYLDIH